MSGKAPQIVIRMRDATRRRVEFFAAREGLTRSAAFRQLIDMGLENAESLPKEAPE